MWHLITSTFKKKDICDVACLMTSTNMYKLQNTKCEFVYDKLQTQTER